MILELIFKILSFDLIPSMSLRVDKGVLRYEHQKIKSKGCLTCTCVENVYQSTPPGQCWKKDIHDKAMEPLRIISIVCLYKYVCNSLTW